MSNHFQALLEQALPKETYLHKWFSHRSRLENWPQESQEDWGPQVVKQIVSWVSGLPQSSFDVEEKEAELETFLAEYLGGFQQHTEKQEEHFKNLAMLFQIFLEQHYCHLTNRWRFLLSFPSSKGRLIALQQFWKKSQKERLHREHTYHLAQELSSFHQKIFWRLHKRLQVEKDVSSIFTQADLGWDLENGRWERMNLEPLIQQANLLEKEKEIQKIAEILGRDHRIKVRPPQNPPESLNPPQELGKSEICGIIHSRNLDNVLSHEMVLLSLKETEGLFFQKEAEGRLLCWDYALLSPPVQRESNKMFQRQAKNERGPIILVVDTSGSMRGKPENIAKMTALAVTRIAVEEKRCCYLINFSTQIRICKISNLQNHLEDLLNFLRFSFHGGTDLAPALRKSLNLMKTRAFKKADVLILSDFSIPKIPRLLRQEIRRHQNTYGSRFYALTISARPLNDIFNIFDAAWVYNIHHNQKQGIDPESLRFF